MPESRTVCSFRAFYRTITPIYTRLQSIDITNWSLEPSIHPASSLSVNGPFLYFPDVRLVDVSRSDFRAGIPSKPALLSSSASVTFFVRPSVSFCYLSCLSVSLTGCPSSCMSLPSQPLDICLTSARVLPLGPSFLIFLTDRLIALIGFSRVVGILVISGRLAPAARMAVNFFSVTVNYKYTSALHITFYIYAYLRYLYCLLLVYS